MQFTTFALFAASAATLVAAAPTANTESLTKRYSSGQCGIHFQQYQKNENGVGGEYEYTVTVKDAVGAIIGGVSKQAIPNYGSFDLSSQLPAQIVITAGAVDSDPVQFAYNGYTFSSSAGCSTGKYDSGSRQGDCGFGC